MKNNDRRKFTMKMQKKLMVLFLVVAALFLFLIFRLYTITRDNGDSYRRQILSQQKYDSTVIPYKRGSILDTNGSVLASSEKVYNIILDSVALAKNAENPETTFQTLRTELGIDVTKARDYFEANKEKSRYYVVAKKFTYDQVQPLMELLDDKESDVTGLWFEDEYQRVYPGGTLACDVIGYTTSDNSGLYGLEQYYNAELSGVPGRTYGYMNEEGSLERTTVPAEDGNSIVTTIDANIQSVVEKYLRKFNEQYANNAHFGNGANNVGCIIMNVHNGEVLAMASYPDYDLNNVRDKSKLIGRQLLTEDGKYAYDEETGTKIYITEENVDSIEGDALYKNFDALWKNYCISDAYEPGSVSKPLTVASAIESGAITGNETYDCGGFLEIGGHKIHCHNRYGDGRLTVTEGVERSCNVAMMHIAQAMGVRNFTKFQHIFNLGLKTNIDLSGEARTNTLIYTASNMNASELATCSFGQGYNCTMIQMISAFSSLINGGYYYEPHMVKKIINSSGATIENIEPRLLKQTISQETSNKIIEMCNQVVTGEYGTGKTARPAGYIIGGKTGTAQTLPRGNGEYVVSFLGYAPYDDPEIAIYVVVDRPNVFAQDDAKYATRIVRSILTEVLPYLGIFQTEELSEKEKKELEELQIELITPQRNEEEEENPENAEGGEEQQPEEPAPSNNEIWKTFKIDPVTGYAIDPNTGDYVDPVTGATIGYKMEENVQTDENGNQTFSNENNIKVAGEGSNNGEDEDAPW
ncbi:MAG: cell division protein FtsI [Lachnospiraceae bacterium]|nr:cell division protein FtsI [Lachnospiraceae bacterium]